MAMAVQKYFVEWNIAKWNNEIACINFLELPMKKQDCYKVPYDEQDCNSLVTRLYNAITCLYNDKL